MASVVSLVLVTSGVLFFVLWCIMSAYVALDVSPRWLLHGPCNWLFVQDVVRTVLTCPLLHTLYIHTSTWAWRAGTHRMYACATYIYIYIYILINHMYKQNYLLIH